MQFRDMGTLLRPNDLLVFNDTRVIKARLAGRKASGGKIEVLVERIIDDNRVLAHVRASKSPGPGTVLILADAFEATMLARHGELFELQFPGDVLALLDAHGATPLPPYITHAADASDDDRYQTVYADAPGAVAAPTAGLHFDDAMLHKLAAQGVAQAFVTLHVGAGTFQPVRTHDLGQHVMHAERYTVPAATQEAVLRARQAGGRVIAVGTTSLRALESAAQPADRPASVPDFFAAPQSGNATAPNTTLNDAAAKIVGPTPASPPRDRQTNASPFHHPQGDTRLFITPGYQFQVVDALFTNFHLPESTLLMLVSALAGVAPIRQAYAHAIAHQYRFFSYGDAMFIESPRHDQP